MNWFERFLLPNAAATHASDVDGLFMFIIYLTIFFFFFNAGLTFYAARRWRRARPTRVEAQRTLFRRRLPRCYYVVVCLPWPLPRCS